MKLRKCPVCGEQTIDGKFCAMCGSPLTQHENSSEDDGKFFSDKLLGEVELRPENEIIRVRRRMFWNILRYVNGVINIEKFLSKMEELIELDRKNCEKMAEGSHGFEHLSSEIHANWIKYQGALREILDDFKRGSKKGFVLRIRAEARRYATSVVDLNKKMLKSGGRIIKTGLDAKKMGKYIDVLKERCAGLEREGKREVSLRLGRVVKYLEDLLGE